MTKLIPAALIFILYSLPVVAQEEMLKGRYIGFKVQGNDNFSTRAYVTPSTDPSFTSAENHGITGELGYGWFYKEKKSFYIGALSGLSYNHSNTADQWNNTFGMVVKKVAFKNIYQYKILFSLSQDLTYTYNYQRVYYDKNSGRDIKNPINVTNSIGFGLKPGIFYKHNRSLVFTAQLSLIGLMLSQRKSNNIYTNEDETLFNYNLFTDFSASSIQCGILWFPGFIKSKKVK